MNDKYLENDKNKYLVLDENKNISIVNLDTNVEELLNFENVLEEKTTNYNKLKKELKELKEKLNDKKIIDKIFIILFLILALGLLNYVPIIYFVITYIITKSSTIIFLGTNKEQEKIIKEKAKKLKREKDKLDKLYVKLDYLKEKYNYKKTNLNDYIENNYCLEHEYLRDKSMSYMNKDTIFSYNENKVKKLVKKPDMK